MDRPWIYIYSITGCVTDQSHNSKSCHSQRPIMSKIQEYFINRCHTSEYLFILYKSQYYAYEPNVFCKYYWQIDKWMVGCLCEKMYMAISPIIIPWLSHLPVLVQPLWDRHTKWMLACVKFCWRALLLWSCDRQDDNLHLDSCCNIPCATSTSADYLLWMSWLLSGTSADNDRCLMQSVTSESCTLIRIVQVKFKMLSHMLRLM